MQIETMQKLAVSQIHLEAAEHSAEADEDQPMTRKPPDSACSSSSIQGSEVMDCSPTSGSLRSHFSR